MKKRKIAVVTGSRAEYGLFRDCLKKLGKEFDLCIIATGMHLKEKYGYTVNEIERDFEVYAKLDTLIDESSGKAMAESVGETTTELAEVFEKIKPDFILVLCDLGWALAGAIAGNYMRIPVAHVHGGDVSGTVDEPVRHAITKLSHIHFAVSKSSAERIMKMGEEGWRVFNVGAPGLDRIITGDFTEKEILFKKYGLDPKKPVIIAVQHPNTDEPENSKKELGETLSALDSLQYQTILIYPNADAGSKEMIKLLDEFNRPFLKKFKSLPREDYLGLLRMASAIVGNSSSGIIEAPSFSLPAVNIGPREIGREMAGNVINVPSSKNLIEQAIKKSVSDENFRKSLKGLKNPYGDGKAGERIADVLSKIKINGKLLQKKITY